MLSVEPQKGLRILCLAVIFTLGLVAIGMSFSALRKSEIALIKNRDLHGPAARIAGIFCLLFGLTAIGVRFWIFLHEPGAALRR